MGGIHILSYTEKKSLVDKTKLHRLLNSQVKAFLPALHTVRRLLSPSVTVTHVTMTVTHVPMMSRLPSKRTNWAA